MFNVSYKRVGGLAFLKIGRINISWSVTSKEKFAEMERRRARHSDDKYLYQVSELAICIALETELRAHAEKVYAPYYEMPAY